MCKIKYNLIHNSGGLSVSFDEGKSRFTQTAADGWQEYHGLFPYLWVAGAGVGYTVILTPVA